MFKYILFLHTCILILVTSNPLQGFPSYPLIQYQENYRNADRPILIQPSDFNSYSHQLMTQNQLIPYQNNPISYNDYVQRIYLDNILQNQAKGNGINPNCAQDGVKIRRYASNPTDSSLGPNIVNNYIIVPTDNIPNKNETIDNKPLQRKTKVKDKTNNSDQNSNNKCSKINDAANNSYKERCSRDKIISEDEKSSLNKKSINNDSTARRKNKKRSKSQSTPPQKEIDNSVSNGKQTNPRNRNSKCRNNQDIRRNLSKDKDSEPVNGETNGGQKTGPSKKNSKDKTKVNNSRKVIKKEDSHHLDQCLPEIDYYFNLNEDCVDLENRCARNYNDDTIKKYQQQFSHLPSDFTDIVSYMNNMMSNQQLNTNLFNTNGNFPYNFDHLYNMQQPSIANSNGSQNKQKKNRRTSRRKKPKKSNKKSSDQNNKDLKQTSSHSSEKLIELPPKFIEDTKTSKLPASTVSSAIYEPHIDATCPAEKSPITTCKTFEDVPDSYQKIPDVPLKLTGDSQENIQNNYDIGHEDYIPYLNVNDIIDEYYPDFRSDNIYLSKEEYDWTNFHDRHYYSSNDNNELHRERRRYKTTDNNNNHEKRYFEDSNNKKNEITENVNIRKYSVDESAFHVNPGQDFSNIKTELDDKDKQLLKTEIYTQPNNHLRRDNIKLKTSSEEVKFRTPPGLDFPDFKTEMINKDRFNQEPEIYYQLSNKADNQFQNNKLSSYSNVKTAFSDEKTNKIVDLNDVETVYGQSKVVKYGFQPNKEETKLDLTNNAEDKILISNDGITTVVIAKSSPY